MISAEPHQVSSAAALPAGRNEGGRHVLLQLHQLILRTQSPYLQDRNLLLVPTSLQNAACQSSTAHPSMELDCHRLENLQ